MRKLHFAFSSLVFVFALFTVCSYAPGAAWCQTDLASQAARIPQQQLSAAADLLKQFAAAEEQARLELGHYCSLDELANRWPDTAGLADSVAAINPALALNTEVDAEWYDAAISFQGEMDLLQVAQAGQVAPNPDWLSMIMVESLQEVVATEAAYYAMNGSVYASLEELIDHGMLSADATLLMNDLGCVVYLQLELEREQKQSYTVSAYFGPQLAYFATERGLIQLGSLSAAVEARDMLRFVVAAEAAYYSRNGSYGDITALQAGRFVSDGFPSLGPAFADELELLLEPATGGQDYMATALVNGEAVWIADSTCVIRAP